MGFSTDEAGGSSFGGFTPTANRVPFGGSTPGTLTDSNNLRYSDSVVSLGIGAAPATGIQLNIGQANATIVLDATSGNGVFDIQKNGTSAIKLRTGSAGHNIDFAANTTNYLNVSGAGAYIGMNINAKEYLFRATGLEMPEACNLILGATTGTKFGTATTQKQAWWNATPVVQGAAIADAAAGATIDAEARTAINTLLARMRTYGLIAT
jgi:hypothetical protein